MSELGIRLSAVRKTIKSLQIANVESRGGPRGRRLKSREKGTEARDQGGMTVFPAR